MLIHLGNEEKDLEDPIAVIARANEMQKKKKRVEGIVKRKSTQRVPASGPLSVILIMLS